jgi:hypothetical protein
LRRAIIEPADTTVLRARIIDLALARRRLAIDAFTICCDEREYGRITRECIDCIEKGPY